MTSPLSRRGLLATAAAVTGAGLFGPVRSARAATALPEVGQTFALSLYTFGTTLVVNLPPPLPALDFTGSRTVKILPGGPDFVRGRTVHFAMEAFHPSFGKVTVRQPDLDADAPGSVIALGPDGLVERWQQPMDITFERCGDLAGPIAFVSLKPARWTADLAGYPPPQVRDSEGRPSGGSLFRLLEPVDFGVPGGHGPSPEGGSGCALADPLEGAAADPDTGAAPWVRPAGMDVNVGTLPD